MKRDISRLMFKKYQHQQFNPGNLPTDPSFDWIQKSSDLPWLQLDISIPTETILNEIMNIKDLLVSHRDDYADHNGWESFCIHGRGYDLTREDEHYVDAPDYHWTKEASDLMPETVSYFKNIWPGHKYRRIRVMRLKPGGYISIHSDTSIQGLQPINIAITQPKNCFFIMEKHGCVPFEPGKAFWLDISVRHTVFNDSDQDRWHLIVHQSIEHPEFQNLVVKSYKEVYNRSNETSTIDHTR
jgi:hypothetical protein